MKKFLVLLLIVSSGKLFAQSVGHTGWLTLANSTKLSTHWGMNLDIQFRSADRLEYLRTFLFRPSVTYKVNGHHTVAAGYALNETFTRLIGSPKNSFTEHRVWEQYTLSHKIKSILLSHRFRLEQRFIERASDDVFSQRFRYLARFMIPLSKQDTFSRGFFTAVQNEVFLNLQNKEQLNNSVFDQNRLYFAAGYRLSPKVDVEAGYLNQAIHGAVINSTNHVIQLVLYTRF